MKTKLFLLLLLLAATLYAQEAVLIVTTNWVTIPAKGGTLREQGQIVTNLVVNFFDENGDNTNAVVYQFKGDTLTKEFVIVTNSVVIKTDPKVPKSK